MKLQLAELADHRSRILKKIEVQRGDVADIARDLQTPIRYFDAGLDAAHFVYRHPTLIAGGLTAILTFWHKGIPGINYLIPPILRFAFDRLLFTSHKTITAESGLNSEEGN